MTLVAVISDTHLPRGAREIPREAWRHIERADVVLHAGDVVHASVLHEIAAYAPLHVAMGNCDGADVWDWGARDVVETAIDGVAMSVVHDAGRAEGRGARMRERFPDARVVVFGHSHLPLLEHGPGGTMLLNPGSPTDRRRAPHHTMALLEIDGSDVRGEIVVL